LGSVGIYLMKRGFTLIELLVVISIISLLIGILLPVVSRARLQAKVTVVNAELRQIGLALDMYMMGNENKYPPTRKDCSMGWEDHQLPPELVKGGYLPPPKPGSGMFAGIEDRFNRINTYKYWSVGELFQNGKFMPSKKASFYVPEGFPVREDTIDKDIIYDDPANSPVTWVIYSQGPKFDAWEMTQQHGPVPKRVWYDTKKRKGIIVRMCLKNGRQIGSFL
jgi:prepilin-type N-terminal cleavage/methylation domain-containing protein